MMTNPIQSTPILLLFFVTLLTTLNLSLVVAHDDVYVTCGSTIKFVHKNSDHHLHASNVNWGSGSGELAVTAIPAAQTTPNTLWQVQTAYSPDEPNQLCPFGNVVKCGDVIRLKHTGSNSFLRSSHHKAPLSGRSEVSSENSGDKLNENFVVNCIGEKIGEKLKQNYQIKLKSVKNNNFLYARSSDNFNQNNCRGCPIQGHLEISAGQDDSNAIFTMQNGFYIPINTERVVYDYNDFNIEPKIIFDSKKENSIPTKIGNHGSNNNKRDEL
jgi:hypothetical protein